jgi:hypothetical protein
MTTAVPVGHTAVGCYDVAGEPDRRLLILATPELIDQPKAEFQKAVFTPIPVMPWTTEVIQDKLQGRNDFRTPIVQPLRAGFPCPFDDTPSNAEVLRLLPRTSRGVPFVYQEARDDIRIVTEKIVDRVDPPRFFPLVGPAQLHHCHWKCTVYYNETTSSGWPFPYQAKRPRIEVVYIDKDHLHQYSDGAVEGHIFQDR